MKNIYLFLPILLALTACNRPSGHSGENISQVLLQNRDTTISPGDDFFKHANGGWIKKNPIPQSENAAGIFIAVRDSVNNAIRRICESSAADKNAAKGSLVQKIGDFYASGMDTAGIDKQGIEPIMPLFKQIEALKAPADLPAVLAQVSSYATGTFFQAGISKDEKNSSKNIFYLYQGGIGMPVKEYYFDKDPQTSVVREAYKIHLREMFRMSGIGGADSVKAAKEVYLLEEKLARASRKIADLRDPYKNYNRMPLKKFQEMTPLFNWAAYSGGLGIANLDSVNVGQPEFFEAFNSLLSTTTPQVMRWYLSWSVLNTYANFLSKPIRDRNFYFYNTVMSGVQKQKPRWQQVVEETNGNLGEIVGQEYVKNYLPPNTKEKLLEIGNNIMEVFREHLQKIDWMSDATRQKALEKLSKVRMKLGYPDKWKDFSSLDISRESYCKNVMACTKWYHNFEIQKFGKPVDKDEWFMMPQTYNAYYDPSLNEIVIPGCNIIVPGYPGLAPDAILYGIVGGGTFGHEITHGFDDQGSKFDAIGNLSDWWTKEDREKFDAKARNLVTQYNSFTVLDSLHVNGENTLGENIADLGGCVMGYEAFMKSASGKKEMGDFGMKPAAEYFLGYAYGWLSTRRTEDLARQIKTDVHSPSQFRVNGPLRNIDAYYDAFGVKEGDKMFLPKNQRVQIW